MGNMGSVGSNKEIQPLVDCKVSNSVPVSIFVLIQAICFDMLGNLFCTVGIFCTEVFSEHFM